MTFIPPAGGLNEGAAVWMVGCFAVTPGCFDVSSRCHDSEEGAGGWGTGVSIKGCLNGGWSEAKLLGIDGSESGVLYMATFGVSEDTLAFAIGVAF